MQRDRERIERDALSIEAQRDKRDPLDTQIANTRLLLEVMLDIRDWLDNIATNMARN